MCHWPPVQPYPPPIARAPQLTIKFIEFTYCNDVFVAKTPERITTLYQPLINNIITRRWNVAPLMILVIRVRAHHKEIVVELTETCPNQGVLNYIKLIENCPK